MKDIIDRLPSNKTLPTADELWGQIYDYCTDERKTFVLPQLAWQALESTNGGIYELVNSGDKTGGRMAFKAAYERVSRGFNGTVEYAFRLGTDLEEREKTILQAIEDGRLLRSEVQPLLPQLDYDGNGVITTVSGLIAAAESQAMLPNKGDEPWQLSAKGAKTLAMMKEKLNTKAI